MKKNNKKEEPKKEEPKYVYSLELTEKQAKLLSWALDTFPRIIEGQDMVYQDMMEDAWERRAKEATGDFMDKEFEGGWYAMRDDAEYFSNAIKKRFWGLERNTTYGLHYDETADISWDIHQVIRHQLWLDRPEEKKSHATVDSFPAHCWGTEPLAKINKI